MEENKHNSGKV